MQNHKLIVLCLLAMAACFVLLDGCATPCGEMTAEDCRTFKDDIHKASRTDSLRMQEQMPAWQSQVYHPMDDPLFRRDSQ